MAKIGIFYASAGGNTAQIAKALQEAFDVEEDDCILMEEDFDEVDQLLSYDVLFLGSSSWGQGDVHFSWVDALFEISSEGISFEGKKIALFGAGDHETHGEHFCSALGKLYSIFSKAGAEFIGFTDASGYTYKASLAQIGDQFCGLAIDNINEKAKTAARIEHWIEQLQDEV